MLDIEQIKKIDKKEMYSVYNNWPQIANESYRNQNSDFEIKNISQIIFVGMGGSGAIHDLFGSILSDSKIHINIVKGYHLPKAVNKNSLIVVTSVSGNTIETLTVLDEAVKLNLNVIGFSSGGKMEKYCMKNQINYRKIPMYHSPRTSFPSFLYSMLKILKPIIPFTENEILESIKNLKLLQEKISTQNLTSSNPSLELAYWIKETPVIYYPWGLHSVAVRFKNSIQENAKSHAMVEDIIEASHNGIVPWEKICSLQPILIRGNEDYIKTKERWEIIKEFFSSLNIEYKEIFSSDGNILTKIVNLIYLLDFATVYKAIILGIDPTPVKSIEFVKKRS